MRAEWRTPLPTNLVSATYLRLAKAKSSATAAPAIRIDAKQLRREITVNRKQVLNFANRCINVTRRGVDGGKIGGFDAIIASDSPRASWSTVFVPTHI